jgi:hypothetical protein
MARIFLPRKDKKSCPELLFSVRIKPELDIWRKVTTRKRGMTEK